MLEYTKIILGILFGFILAFLFAKACNNRNFIIIDADKESKENYEKCYRFASVNSTNSICPSI